MRCFCFKPKDKNATEPNARPVATKTGGSRNSVFAAAVPFASDVVATVSSVVPSGTPGSLGNLGTANLGTPEILHTAQVIENRGTEHALMWVYPSPMFREHSNNALLQYRHTNRHPRHPRQP